MAATIWRRVKRGFFSSHEIVSARLSRIAYVNGSYVLHRDAMVHIEDRGYQFADGVYEVCEVFRGALIDEKRHFERLAYSLAELQIAAPLRLELSPWWSVKLWPGIGSRMASSMCR